VEPEFTVEDGEMRVPEGPGIGVQPDLDRIASLSVRRATFP
jgi:L-alanine-DL-glutamate epimerase-like enolase superfamily enzyme